LRGQCRNYLEGFTGFPFHSPACHAGRAPERVFSIHQFLADVNELFRKR
jgi:hypothetical protein